MGGITEAITDAIGSAGIYAIFALMLLDAVFPAASEVVMLYGGALAAGAFPEHGVSVFGASIESEGAAYVAVALAGGIGYWLGGLFGYWIGYAGGRPLLDRYGKLFHLSPAKVDRAEEWFRRHGLFSIVLTRNLPVVRSFVAIPAGIAETRFRPYVALSLLGSLPWAFGFAAAGLALGTGWEQVHDRFRYADYVVVGLIVLGIGFLAVRHRLHRARAARTAEAEEL